MKILGMNDEQTVCDKCGKTHLKKTVVLELENGEIVRYGVDCAAQALKGNKSAKSKNAVAGYAYAIELARKYIKTYTAIQTNGIVFNQTGYSFISKGDTLLDRDWNVIASK